MLALEVALSSSRSDRSAAPVFVFDEKSTRASGAGGRRSRWDSGWPGWPGMRR